MSQNNFSLSRSTSAPTRPRTHGISTNLHQRFRERLETVCLKYYTAQIRARVLYFYRWYRRTSLQQHSRRMLGQYAIALNRQLATSGISPRPVSVGSVL